MTKDIKILILFLVLSTLIMGCGLFSTRTPEEPDTGKSSFVPPTSPSIVISNFISAVAEKNVENYISCLADTTFADKFPFYFKPTANAYALYSSIFKNWNNYSERNYFNTLISALPADINPKITLQNPRFEIILPDSAVFVADYELIVEHNLVSIDKHFIGTLQFTVYPRDNGLWSIKTWYDLQNIQDSVQSWSFLKAQLAN